jgi:protein-disulfide isomerase
VAGIVLALALSGEAYAMGQVRLGRVFGPAGGKGLRLDVSDTLMLGRQDAKVSVVLFFDFGCPACRACVAKATELVEKYPDCVNVRFKHYPLERECNPKLSEDIHHTACRAALAGQAAQALGLDAKALKAIFNRQEDGFSNLVLARVGKEIGAPEGWTAMFMSPAVKALVDRDIAEGNALNLREVPVVFVNGRRVDARRLEGVIDRLCQ